MNFAAPLRVGDFVEGIARVVERGNTSRKVEARLYKVLSVDEKGLLIDQDGPVLAVSAVATIVVGRGTAAQES